MRKDQNGFGHWLMLLMVGVVVVVGAVGLRVYHRDHKTSTSTTAAIPVQIKSTSDLQTAQKALDNSALPDPNTLNADLTSLL